MSNPRALRKFHLYAGCIFAPALVFFILSGTWQVYRLNDARKDGSYRPPQIVQVLSDVHTDQRVPGWTKKRSEPLKLFVLLMAVFLLLTIAVGIRLAFQTARPSWIVWLCLLLGTLLPVFLLRF